MPNILDRRFQYTPSVATDIRKTFARVIRERTAAQEVAEDAATDELLERTKGLAEDWVPEHHANLDTIFTCRRIARSSKGETT